jgi:hypothetical protein
LPDNSFHTFIDRAYNSNPRFAKVSFSRRGICLPDNSFHTFIDCAYNSNPRFSKLSLERRGISFIMQ